MGSDIATYDEYGGVASGIATETSWFFFMLSASKKVDG